MVLPTRIYSANLTREGRFVIADLTIMEALSAVGLRLKPGGWSPGRLITTSKEFYLPALLVYTLFPTGTVLLRIGVCLTGGIGATGKPTGKILEPKHGNIS